MKRPPPRGAGAAILDAGVSAGQRPSVAMLSRRGGGREGSGGGGALRDRRGAGTGPGPGAGGGGGRPWGRPGLTRVTVPAGPGALRGRAGCGLGAGPQGAAPARAPLPLRRRALLLEIGGDRLFLAYGQLPGSCRGRLRAHLASVL